MMEEMKKKTKYGNCPDIDKYDFIGSYGTSNTYTANIPEKFRDKYTRVDSVRRTAHANPNGNW